MGVNYVGDEADDVLSGEPENEPDIDDPLAYGRRGGHDDDTSGRDLTASAIEDATPFSVE